MRSNISGLIGVLTLASTVLIANSSPLSNSFNHNTPNSNPSSPINKWVVLVAGSNEYYNYRHQADIYHAYQVFHDNGYPDSNIIVMQFDDIAYNPSNPFQGVVLNDVGGRNMYVNIPKDYVGNDVNPTNFLNVLLGKAGETGQKVIIPNPENKIFIYFADHGATGLIAFPTGDVLYAHELNDTFTQMYLNNAYESIVVYLEACESGSMFSRVLSPEINIYAVTASTPTQSSWACCQDDTVHAYLGDMFSVIWLENVDSFERVMNQTFQDMFKLVKNETSTSHVCEYGNLTMSGLSISEYLVYNEVKDVKLSGQVTEKVNVKRVGKDSRLASLEKKLEFEHQWSGEMDWDFGDMYEVEDEVGGDKCNPPEIVDTRCLKRKIQEFEITKGSRLSEFELKYVRYIGWECITCLNLVE